MGNHEGERHIRERREATCVKGGNQEHERKRRGLEGKFMSKQTSETQNTAFYRLTTRYPGRGPNSPWICAETGITLLSKMEPGKDIK